MLSFLLHLVELQQGLLAALAGLLQLRVPGGKALFQLRSQSLHPQAGKKGLQQGISLMSIP